MSRGPRSLARRTGERLVWVLPALAVLALAHEPALATQYYVRTGGNNACTGTTDADGSSGACAWADPDYAVNHIACGDTVDIHTGTYTGVVSGPKLQCTSNTPVIIQGAPGDARSGIIIDGDGENEAILWNGGSGTSDESRYVTFRHFTVRNATKYLIRLDTTATHITFDDILFDDNPGVLTGRNASPRSYALAWGPTSYYCNNCEVKNCTFEGDPDSTATSGLKGSDSSVIYGAASNSKVHDNTVTNWKGGFFNENGIDNVIESNFVSHIGCDADDGCIQVYNDHRTIVRFNRFVNVCSLNDYNAVVSLRATSASPCTNASRYTSALVYNNTFAALPGCATGLGRRVFKINSEVCGLTDPQDQIFLNNIVYADAAADGFGSSSSGVGAVSLYHSTDTSTRACAGSPSILRVDHNLMYQNRKDYLNDDPSGECLTSPASTGSTFVAQVALAPSLDSSYAPDNADDPACQRGVNNYVTYSPDSQTTKTWLGALQGSCSSSAPACGNSNREGYEDCDGTDLAGKACTDFGFSGGTLACSSTCKWNTASCTSASVVRLQTAKNNTSGSSLTLTIDEPFTNNLVVIASGSRAAGTSEGITSISPSGYNWQKADLRFHGGNALCELWYGIAPASAGTSVTITYSGSRGRAAVLAEYQGLTTINPLDVTAGNTGSSTTIDSGTTATTTIADELGVAALCQANTTTPAFSDPTNDYDWAATDPNDAQAVQSSSNNVRAGLLEKVLSFTGTQNTSVTGANASWAGVIATFKTPANVSSAAFCQNYIVESGESCDLSSLAGQNCYSQTCTAGTLKCTSTCSFDTSGCNGLTLVCEDSYCAAEGSRCSHNDTCGTSGCCNYTCASDPTCIAADPCPDNACSCAQ